MRTVTVTALALTLGTGCMPSLEGTVTVSAGGSEIDSFDVEGAYKSVHDRTALHVWGESSDAWFELWRGDPSATGDITVLGGDDWGVYDADNGEITWPDGNLASFDWNVDDSQLHTSYDATVASDSHQLLLELGWRGVDRATERQGEDIASTVHCWADSGTYAGHCRELKNASDADLMPFEVECGSIGGTFSASDCGLSTAQLVSICHDPDPGRYDGEHTWYFGFDACLQPTSLEALCDNADGDYEVVSADATCH